MTKILATTIATLLTAGAAFATDGTWISTTTGLWSDTSRWNLGNVADGADATADFSTLDVPLAGLTVNLDSARTLGNLTFGDTLTTATSAGGWTLTNNSTPANILTLQTSAGTPTITVNTLGTNGSNVVARVTISAVLTGTQGFTKAGTGGVILTGANTFSGGTVTLSAGYLALSNASALGSAPLTISGGTLDSTVAGITLNAHNEAWNGNFSFAGSQSLNLGTGTVTLSTNRTVTVSANTLTVGGNVNQASSGLVFTKAGAGTLVLNGVNSWTGGTSISAGVLRFGTVAGSVPTTGLITIGANGALAATGPSAATQSPGFDSVTAWLTSGKIVTTSTGALAITAANDNSAIDFATPGYNSLFLGAAGTNTFSGTLTQSGAYRLGGGGTLTVTSQLNAAQGLTVAPTGTLILGGTNGYTGITTLASTSVLRVASASALGTADGTTGTGTTVASGGRLELDGGVTVGNELLTISGAGTNNQGALSNNSGNNTWGGNIVIAADATRIGSSAGILDVTGVVDDGVNTFQLVIRNSSGTNGSVVRLSNVNTYGGNTQDIVGTLQLGVDGALPQTSVIMGNNSGQGSSATLDLNGHSQTLANVTPVSGNNITVRVANSSATAGALTLNVVGTATTGTTGGVILGATSQNNFSVTKTGAGTYTIGTASTYTGATNINNGTLALAATGSLASTAVAVAAGATFDVSAVAAGFNVAAGRTLLANGTVTGAVTVNGTMSGSGTISGAISGSTTATLGAGSDALTTGTLTAQSTLTTLGATIAIKLAPSQVQTSDRFSIAGAINLTSTDKLNLIALENFGTTTTFTIATLGSYAAGTNIFDTVLINGAASQDTDPLAANYASVTYNPTSITVDVANVIAAPEPGTLTSLVGGIGLLLGLRRFRRSGVPQS